MPLTSQFIERLADQIANGKDVERIEEVKNDVRLLIKIKENELKRLKKQQLETEDEYKRLYNISQMFDLVKKRRGGKNR